MARPINTKVQNSVPQTETGGLTHGYRTWEQNIVTFICINIQARKPLDWLSFLGSFGVPNYGITTANWTIGCQNPPQNICVRRPISVLRIAELDRCTGIPCDILASLNRHISCHGPDVEPCVNTELFLEICLRFGIAHREQMSLVYP